MSVVIELAEPLRIPAGHPSLPGHFPGAPVVPGVVLLDAVAGLLERSGQARLAHIAMVKFLTPLGPDQRADLRIVVDGAQVSFRIQRAGAVVLSGRGRLA
ncbi:MAG TPA: hydroxymyristoyl-ACP dehydratase [Rhodanobacteraceae bacterium]|nr:hydroxymyristoyl-ACP dehydratase [Rhodanobacteraceae bacterium]